MWSVGVDVRPPHALQAMSQSNFSMFQITTNIDIGSFITLKMKSSQAHCIVGHSTAHAPF